MFDRMINTSLLTAYNNGPITPAINKLKSKRRKAACLSQHCVPTLITTNWKMSCIR